ncbi:putative beta-xylosidase [Phaeomoniella chlamydospora]|uniref:Putative beta-xylosidase n=1 Tax=Phaeomoniella chlamydospora TaxID=158046 RepID=A0A0G2FRR5_PHACM|nr:putative beta-xylosidase [Phaeomoniella chlamydospora]
MAAPTDSTSVPFDISGKTAIITGAGSGINLAFAAILLSRKCNVVFSDLSLRSEAEQLIAKHSDQNQTPRAVFVKTDVTSWPELSQMFDAALSEFGDFDLVVPGAGVYEPHWSNFWHPPGSLESKDPIDSGHYALLDINLTHPIRVTQLALSHWTHPRVIPNSAYPTPAKVSPSNPKRIVHISSVAGQMPNFNAPIYGASKFAISGFVRSLAPLDGGLGVRVTAVAPGIVRTPLWTEHPEKMVYLDQEQDGWVTPEEVAEAMLRCAEEEGVSGAIKNPIISGWNPDPAILRVGDEYLLAVSSFEYFPGTPIYKSKDLQNWDLFTHAQTNPKFNNLYGTPTGAGVWAPGLSLKNGMYYLTSVTRWTYDPTARVWARAYWSSSKDLIHWSDPVWAEPWGIDPSLFHDPKTGADYLVLMSPNNNVQKLWGIYGCQINLVSGNCIGDYVSLWNGTIPQNSGTRAEGPKMFYKDKYYYLLIAEGGTDVLHRATIARSTSPEGPFTPAPNNPLMYNGAYPNLTVQSTGHATFVESPSGDWYASFLARRNINGSSPLGRETFLTTVDWDDGWPILNSGKPITLSKSFGSNVTRKTSPYSIDFDTTTALDKSWYTLRTPYGKIVEIDKSGLSLVPNVFSLNDRDVPAAILRKQHSLNMTFTATIEIPETQLTSLTSIGVSSYLSEFSHYDIGLRGCANSTGMCVYTAYSYNATTIVHDHPLGTPSSSHLTFVIRAEPLKYSLGFISSQTLDIKNTTWLLEYPSSNLAFAPTNWFVFSGPMFALFASGNGNPWPWDIHVPRFIGVKEKLHVEDIPDYDIW